MGGKSADVLRRREHPATNHISAFEPFTGRNIEDREVQPAVVFRRTGCRRLQEATGAKGLVSAVVSVLVVRGPVGPTKSAGVLEGGWGTAHANHARRPRQVAQARQDANNSNEKYQGLPA